MPREPLPIDDHLAEVVARARGDRALVLVAAPGAGKTTRVPPALADDGPVIVLQPRRVAARAIAARIAFEQGWTLGREVGWHVRLERRFGHDTRVLLATEGILTARLQEDPLASDFRTIVLDEFHERSIHADLGLALARQAWLARDDLRLVVMSATLDAAPVAAFLAGCPVLEMPGRVHPLDISYAPDSSLVDSVRGLVAPQSGSVLAFLPGTAEIRRAMTDLRAWGIEHRVDVLELHGSLDAAAQAAAIRPSSTRRVILATNIAETSLTVPGVSAVVDTGLHKVARYDTARGIDSLDTERISRDAADQRAGRAARLGPGRVIRMWAAHDRLRPHREPDVRRVDLAGPVLDLLAWGADPRGFEWFERPSDDALQAAERLLARLGATAGHAVTPLGQQLGRLPLHPRLARILVAGRGAFQAAAACAILSERRFHVPSHATTTCDLLAVLDRWADAPPHIRGVARELEHLATRVIGDARTNEISETELRQALLAGYPDRVAKRRAPGSRRVLMASGTGAVLSASSNVAGGEYLVALDVRADSRTPEEARVDVASLVERAWLSPTSSETVHEIEPTAGRVRAVVRARYDALVLRERPIDPDPDVAARLLAEAARSRPLAAEDELLLRRLRFAGREVDLGDLLARAVREATSFTEIDLSGAVPFELRRDLDELAPETLRVPSGRSVRLNYGEDGSVSAKVKLQELFGLSETPRIGRRQVPVVFHLLAPNGQPVQTTRDLRSFWENTYPDVRKELRGRYPKHPWPEDPWTAPPTARTKRR